MYISAVISEFNPFHLGHLYLINKIKSSGATHIVSVMSGNFVQRAEPAIASKWKRAETALKSGVDLVIEIPAVKSVASAEKYAYAGVQIADALGCVDSLCFGSECGKIDLLSKISDTLEKESVNNLIRDFLKCGMTYAKARETAILQALGENFKKIIKEPNNILAIEYIKAINKINPGINVYTVKREGQGHDENSNGNGAQDIACASFIRQLVKGGEEFKQFVPAICKEIVEQEVKLKSAPADLLYTERAVLSKLRGLTREDFLKLPDISEGIEYRILEAVKDSGSMEELYFKIKTKRYTMARIRRIVLSAFLGITRELQERDASYIRVLGFNSKGKEILKKMKNTAKLPIVASFADVKKLDESSVKAFELESKISDLYALMLPKVSKCNIDKTSKVIVLE